MPPETDYGLAVAIVVYPLTMCGICGVVQVTGSSRPIIAPEILDWMTDLMTHRGPNDRGTYGQNGVAIGVRRLSIVDVDGGHQPVSSEDGSVWAAQNGELYNHGDLRAELLEGRPFVCEALCDTEILPHLYEREGTGLAASPEGEVRAGRLGRPAAASRDRA